MHCCYFVQASVGELQSKKWKNIKFRNLRYKRKKWSLRSIQEPREPQNKAISRLRGLTHEVRSISSVISFCAPFQMEVILGRRVPNQFMNDSNINGSVKIFHCSRESVRLMWDRVYQYYRNSLCREIKCDLAPGKVESAIVGNRPISSLQADVMIEAKAVEVLAILESHVSDHFPWRE